LTVFLEIICFLVFPMLSYIFCPFSYILLQKCDSQIIDNFNAFCYKSATVKTLITSFCIEGNYEARRTI
jgi:hypothetical protein